VRLPGRCAAVAAAGRPAVAAAAVAAVAAAVVTAPTAVVQPARQPEGSISNRTFVLYRTHCSQDPVQREAGMRLLTTSPPRLVT
jgi:hypothetical protein